MIHLALLLALQDDALNLGAADKDALKKAEEIVTVKLLKEIVGYLASDDLEGRGTGTEGNRKAGDFIAKHFQAAGLKPVGDKDEKGEPTFFQNFKIQKKDARNVLGFLEGSDPKLKDEIIVVGGHYDHLGRGPSMSALGPPTLDDDIYNGADDNASGSGSTVALAHAFGESGLKPKRSILFIAYTGEELGLLGSKYYVRHPAFDIKKHVFDLNMDMVGRNPDQKVLVMGTDTAKGDVLDKVSKAAAKRSGLNAEILETSYINFGDSDHASWRDAGIPILFFFTWVHDDYHDIGDSADKIAYENMEKIDETGIYVLLAMANAAAAPEYNPDHSKDEYSRGESLADLFKPKVRFPLGIKGEPVTEDDQLELMGVADKAGALKVTEVKKDSVAEKAGLKTGDVILTIAEKPLPKKNSDRQLPQLLNKNIRRGTDVPVVVWRDGKKVDLKARWEK